MERMEFFQLRYFVAAARHLNFSRAATEVFIAQPSLSQQIANLERELGTPLFARTGRAVRLTDAGIALLEHAERILAQEDAARRAVRAVAGLEAGRLIIETLPTPSQHLLPPYLARFRQEYPKIELQVREAVPARAVGEAVAAGRADLGILHLPCAVDNLEMRQLLIEELVIVAPENHPLTRRETPPALGDLADENFVWVPEGTTAEHPFYAACLAAGFAPRIACISGSGAGMQALVAAGLGISLLPRLAAHPPAGAVVLELAPPRPTRTLAIVWRGDGALSHAAATFLKMLE
jgi:DNA-binding transcriptional LysR family regulator